MEYIDDVVIDGVLDELPQDFDSHHFFRKLIRMYPSEYTKELSRYQDNADPFLVLHPLIAKELARNGRLRKMGKVTSPNIGGESTSNEAWQKI